MHETTIKTMMSAVFAHTQVNKKQKPAFEKVHKEESVLRLHSQQPDYNNEVELSGVIS